MTPAVVGSHVSVTPPRSRRYGIASQLAFGSALVILCLGCRNVDWTLRLKDMGIEYNGVKASTTVEVQRTVSDPPFLPSPGTTTNKGSAVNKTGQAPE